MRLSISRCDVPSEGCCGAGIGFENRRHDPIMEVAQLRGSGLEMNDAAGKPYFSETLNQVPLLVLRALIHIARSAARTRGAPSKRQRSDTNVELLQLLEKICERPAIPIAAGQIWVLNLEGTSKNRRCFFDAAKLPANDSVSFSFQFIDVHSGAARHRYRDQFFEVPIHHSAGQTGRECSPRSWCATERPGIAANQAGGSSGPGRSWATCKRPVANSLGWLERHFVAYLCPYWG